MPFLSWPLTTGMPWNVMASVFNLFLLLISQVQTNMGRGQSSQIYLITSSFFTEHLAKLAFHQMQYFCKWELPMNINMVNWKVQEKRNSGILVKRASECMYMFDSSQSVVMPLRLSDNLAFLYTQKLLIMLLLDFSLVLPITFFWWGSLGIWPYIRLFLENKGMNLKKNIVWKLKAKEILNIKFLNDDLVKLIAHSLVCSSDH